MTEGAMGDAAETYSVTLSFDGDRIDDRTVQVPSWETHWGRLVYPLFITDQARTLHPIGTSFRFSKLSHFLTALHCVRDGLRVYHPNRDLLVRQGLKEAMRRNALGHNVFVVLQAGPNPRVGNFTAELRTFMTMHAAPPTDLVVGNIQTQDNGIDGPHIVPTISFAPPRIGETVRCVGYAEGETFDGGLNATELESGGAHPLDRYRHKLLIVTGQVKRFIYKGLMGPSVQGPTFIIDADVPHGLSGSPVFNEAGHVCGVVSSGASNFFGGEPATAVSLLYPMFLTELAFSLKMGGVFTLNATGRPVVELVSTQAIQTDGSEWERLHSERVPEGMAVGVSFPKEDWPYVFDDLDAYGRNEPSTPLDTSAGLLRFKPNLDHPLVKRAQE